MKILQINDLHKIISDEEFSDGSISSESETSSEEESINDDVTGAMGSWNNFTAINNAPERVS